MDTRHRTVSNRKCACGLTFGSYDELLDHTVLAEERDEIAEGIKRERRQIGRCQAAMGESSPIAKTDYELLIDRSSKRLKSLNRRLTFLERPAETTRASGVDQAQIDAAMSVAVDEVLPNAVRKGYTRCFNHDDRRPSMKIYRKDNRVHCFACNKSFGVIDVVMQTTNSNFVRAVRLLTSGRHHANQLCGVEDNSAARLSGEGNFEHQRGF